MVTELCSILDELIPVSENDELTASQKQHLSGYADLIEFVTDRPGHDMRYAINANKIKDELGWKPHESASSGLRKTVQWYLDHPDWWTRILSGEYRLQRQGLGTQS